VVIANGTKDNALLYVAHRSNEPVEIGFGRAHNMKCQPLRRFVSNARQALQLIN
jgi:hypothetical protein